MCAANEWHSVDRPGEDSIWIFTCRWCVGIAETQKLEQLKNDPFDKSGENLPKVSYNRILIDWLIDRD